MAGRCYTRNGVWGWSIEAQRKALADAGAYDKSREFCDELPATKAKRPAQVKPEWLTERVKLLKATGRTRGERMNLGTILALAVGEGDLVSCVVALAARRDTIFAADSGLTFGPEYPPEVIDAAVQDWQRAKKDAQTRPGRAEGNRVAADKRRAETMQKLKPARPLWRDRSPKRLTVAQIEAQVGLSGKTLYSELGRRPAVRKKGKTDE